MCSGVGVRSDTPGCDSSDEDIAQRVSHNPGRRDSNVSVVFVYEPISVGLVTDYFDISVLCLPTQHSRNTVCTIELLTVFFKHFKNLARRHRLLLVGLFEHRLDALEVASAYAHISMYTLITL